MNTLTIKGEYLQGALRSGNQQKQKGLPGNNGNGNHTLDPKASSGQSGIKMIGDQAYRLENGQLTAIGQEWDRTKGPANMRFADPVSTQRQGKDGQVEKKKLSYNSKKISSIIRASKTLSSAKSAVSKAKFEVADLKKKRGNTKYDQDEVEMAINHAMAMERIAQKHQRNIETEEFAKRGIKSHYSQVSPETLEEAEKEFRHEDWERSSLREGPSASSTMDELIGMTGDMQAAERSAEESDFSKDLEKYMMEASKALEDFAEGELMDMAQDLMAYSDDFDEEDYHKMEVRHRNSENREIAKADMQYMKDYMEYLRNKPETSSELAMSSYLC